MKSYTDLDQSKKLAEILPLESADMHSETIDIDGSMVFIVVGGLGDKTKSNYGSPIWSLAALLSILPDDCGIDKEDGKYVASYLVLDECGTYVSDNPVDACVAMIEKLHELNLL